MLLRNLKLKNMMKGTLYFKYYFLYKRTRFPKDNFNALSAPMKNGYPENAQKTSSTSGKCPESSTLRDITQIFKPSWKCTETWKILDVLDVFWKNVKKFIEWQTPHMWDIYRGALQIGKKITYEKWKRRWCATNLTHI